MKVISLTTGGETYVDDEDFEYLIQWKWHSRVADGYVVRRTSIKGGLKQSTVWMHKDIMKTPDNMVTDHIDGNPLNNQKSNLRICTIQQNGMNRGKQRNNTSGYKGVTGHRSSWQSQIKKQGKMHYIGAFTTPEDAARAYDKKALELFGEFAKLNFPPKN